MNLVDFNTYGVDGFHYRSGCKLFLSLDKVCRQSLVSGGMSLRLITRAILRLAASHNLSLKVTHYAGTGQCGQSL